ncbi:hypothetical protein B0T26DRAFT_871458 [Lasiosphaeria miniovina]|uniref:AB hydrolase-1 domain-containing protein n=1 Tax=Lasiosphaeria miniovina TaxID=1954250 RepID=A0AA40AJA2_9PEZI|nr:uncharacterized protein B0T26DRAFT_871458 [Lasiosphaeria miniovina]KAK0716800.1 hypothetical protein B0T26DRAFT_871458 [Lasiosphaeria miniovina]
MVILGLATALLSLGATLSAAAAAPSVAPRESAQKASSKCSNVQFIVSATAQNVKFVSPPDPKNATAILAFLGQALSTGVPTNGTQTVSGDWIINGVYCKPTVTTRPGGGVLQFLVHGSLYDKSFWSGVGQGALYDYQAFANLAGYHTLAIDRLGHGSNPQRPDPVDVVQPSLSIEIIHQIIAAIRGNTERNALDRGFSKIAYVGHSHGSMLGQGLAARYPSDADASVLTGYSQTPNLVKFAENKLGPAAVLRPTQYAGQPLGELVSVNGTTFIAGFYGPAGSFDPAVARADVAVQATTSVGELIGAQILGPAPAYVNPVLVATGVNDNYFCATPVAACNTILANVHSAVFPNVAKFEYTAIPFTGHVMQLSYSAPVTALRIQVFLDKFF